MLFTESTKIRLGYLGTVEGKGMYEKAKNNPEQIINLYKDNEPNDKKQLDANREFFKTKHDIHSYFFFARTDGADIFVELPLVHNNELFKWTRRDWGRSKTLFAQLQQGSFKYNCTFNLVTKSAHINVLWGKEHLKHIMIQNATNKDILDAISEWEEEFVYDVNSSRTEALTEYKK